MKEMYIYVTDMKFGVSLLQEGKLQEAVDNLLSLEKQTRTVSCHIYWAQFIYFLFI